MYRPSFKTKNNGVPVLSKHDIEIIGENFIRDFCPGALDTPQEIDVEGFIEMYLGLNVDYQYLSNDGRYLGMMVFNDTDKVIVYNPEKNRADYLHVKSRTVIIDNTLLEGNQEHRYRYTMAHEGAHDIFHSGFYAYNPNQMSFFDNPSDNLPMVQCRSVGASCGFNKSWTDTEWMEWQSNFFSSVLLMPSIAVRKVVEQSSTRKVPRELKWYGIVHAVSRTFNVSPEAAKYRLEELGCIRHGLLGDVGIANDDFLFSLFDSK